MTFNFEYRREGRKPRWIRIFTPYVSPLRSSCSDVALDVFLCYTYYSHDHYWSCCLPSTRPYYPHVCLNSFLPISPKWQALKSRWFTADSIFWTVILYAYAPEKCGFVHISSCNRIGFCSTSIVWYNFFLIYCNPASMLQYRMNHLDLDIYVTFSALILFTLFSKHFFDILLSVVGALAPLSLSLSPQMAS